MLKIVAFIIEIKQIIFNSIEYPQLPIWRNTAFPNPQLVTKFKMLKEKPEETTQNKDIIMVCCFSSL